MLLSVRANSRPLWVDSGPNPTAEWTTACSLQSLAIGKGRRPLQTNPLLSVTNNAKSEDYAANPLQVVISRGLHTPGPKIITSRPLATGPAE